MVHKEMSLDTGSAFGHGRRKERRVPGFQGRQLAGSPGSLDCPVVLLPLFQQPQHRLRGLSFQGSGSCLGRWEEALAASPSVLGGEGF